MYGKKSYLIYFFTFSFISNYLLAQDSQLDRAQVNSLLTKEQLELFQGIPKEFQPINISGHPTIPTKVFDSNGAFLVPQRIFPEYDKTTILELINQNITTINPNIDTHILKVPNLEKRLRLNEIRLYKSLHDNGHHDTVAPGQIGSGLVLTGETPAHFSPETLATLRKDMKEWARDACNHSQPNFSVLLEDKIGKTSELIPTGSSNFDVDTIKHRRELASVARSFDRDCFKTYKEAIEDGNINELIKTRSVIFTIGDTPFCGGVRVSKTRVLTARHCFYSSKTGEAKKFTSLIIFKRQANISAYILDNQYRAEKIKGFSFEGNRFGKDRAHFSIENDFMFVNLVNSPSLSDPQKHGPLSLNKPIQFNKPLTLIGYYYYYNPENFFGLKENYSRNWRDGLRVTKGSYCRALDASIDGDCIAHSCQSMPVFSGGGLFYITGGDTPSAQLIGINSLGGEGSTSNCKPFESKLSSGQSFVGPHGGIALSSKKIFSRKSDE